MTQFDPSALADIVALLGATPYRIEAVTRGMSDEDLSWKPSADAWSVNEVIAHLRACADVWGGSIEKMLKSEEATLRITIRYVSPRSWIRKTAYLTADFQSNFIAFRKQRDGLLQSLSTLKQEGWYRGATIEATKLSQETVLSYSQRLARHEVGHCEQIDRILDARRRR